MRAPVTPQPHHSSPPCPHPHPTAGGMEVSFQYLKRRRDFGAQLALHDAPAQLVASFGSTAEFAGDYVRRNPVVTTVDACPPMSEHAVETERVRGWGLAPGGRVGGCGGWVGGWWGRGPHVTWAPMPSSPTTPYPLTPLTLPPTPRPLPPTGAAALHGHAARRGGVARQRGRLRR